MTIIESILVAASLCADCFAVSLCSGVTLKKATASEIAKLALAFALIQSGLLLAGWEFGSFLAGFVDRISRWIGFALLLYVGGSMLIEGIKGDTEQRDLNGWKHIIIGGVATSIDALAVGVAHSMESTETSDFLPLLISVFVVTAISVTAGVGGGRIIGSKIGRWAEIVGGSVLICIGVTILF